MIVCFPLFFISPDGFKTESGEFRTGRKVEIFIRMPSLRQYRSAVHVINMRGPGPRVVLRVSSSCSFCIRFTCTIKAFGVSKIESSTYLLLINWCGGSVLEPTSRNRRPNTRESYSFLTQLRRYVEHFVVQARLSRKPNTQQQPWLLLHGPRSSGVSRKTSL